MHIQSASICEEGNVRLVGSQAITEGALEYCSNNIWYSLCADTWQELEATVVCSTLGFSTNLGRLVKVILFIDTKGNLWL